MSVNDLFWIFLIIIAMQPLLRQKALEFGRRRCLIRLEKKRSSRVIIMVHRQETMALLGFPIFRYIDINDSEEVIRAIHLTDPDVPIDLILHTPGGLVLASPRSTPPARAAPPQGHRLRPPPRHERRHPIALAADESVMRSHRGWGRWTRRSARFPPAPCLRPGPKNPGEDPREKTGPVLAKPAGLALRAGKTTRDPRREKTPPKSGGKGGDPHRGARDP